MNETKIYNLLIAFNHIARISLYHQWTPHASDVSLINETICDGHHYTYDNEEDFDSFINLCVYRYEHMWAKYLYLFSKTILYLQEHETYLAKKCAQKVPEYVFALPIQDIIYDYQDDYDFQYIYSHYLNKNYVDHIITHPQLESLYALLNELQRLIQNSQSDVLSQALQQKYDMYKFLEETKEMAYIVEYIYQHRESSLDQTTQIKLDFLITQKNINLDKIYSLLFLHQV